MDWCSKVTQTSFSPICALATLAELSTLSRSPLSVYGYIYIYVGFVLLPVTVSKPLYTIFEQGLYQPSSSTVTGIRIEPRYMWVLIQSDQITFRQTCKPSPPCMRLAASMAAPCWVEVVVVVVVVVVAPSFQDTVVIHSVRSN